MVLGLNSKVYERRVSEEEADKGKLFIFKSKLSKFPSVDRSFQVEVDGEMFEAKIDAVPCTCVGPDKPHHHYYLASKELIEIVSKKKGEMVTVYKTGEETYRLSFT
ncbi:MAG: hypothetical protein ACE5KU_06515 [Nitrososphaerales archaeon]